eukprot:2309995-Rhodomonas_salina.3
MTQLGSVGGRSKERDESAEEEEDEEEESAVLGLEAMVDFVLHACKSHIDLICPQVGDFAWLRSNRAIDAATQAAWFNQSISLDARSGFPSVQDALVQYVPAMTWTCPLIVRRFLRFDACVSYSEKAN